MWPHEVEFWKVVWKYGTFDVYDDHHTALTVSEDMGDGFGVEEATYREWKSFRGGV